MAKTPAEQKLVAKLTAALSEVAKAMRGPYKKKPHPLETAKKIFESIPPELQPKILAQAVGKGIRRFQAAANLVADCEPSQCVDQFIRAGLSHQDEKFRGCMVQTVGVCELSRFAPELAKIILDDDDDARWWAVIAAQSVRGPACLRALLKFAETFGDEHLPFSLRCSLSRYDSPSVKPQLERAFRTHPEDRHRVCAARGLGQQKNKEAIRYLVSKLDEPDIDSESRRAAQALSEIYGWDIEWSPKAQQEAKEKWAAMKK